MMLYKYLLYFLLPAAMVLQACKKEKSSETEAPSGNCGYAPYTAGSTFTYESVNGSTDTARYTLTVAGDTLLHGKTYHKLSDGDTTAYVRCENNTYYQLLPAISLQGYESDSILSVYLKDDLPAGGSWTDTVTATVTTGTDISVVLKYTVTEKGISKTVLGRSFTDVIAVRLDAAAILMGAQVPIGTLATTYYAREAGLIELDAPEDTTLLRSFAIK